MRFDFLVAKEKIRQHDKRKRRKGSRWNAVKLRSNKIPERYINSKVDLSSNLNHLHICDITLLPGLFS